MSITGNRNIGVELLRILLMFCIVFGHCCSHGAFQNDRLVLTAGATTFFAVNAFAFISGWFSIKTTPLRFLRFVGIGLFWSIIVWILGGGFRLHMGWYGNSYLALMLLAPYINGGIDYMIDKRGLNTMVATLLLFLTFTWLMWLPLRMINVDLVPNGFGPKTTFTLVVMYILGRTLSRIEYLKQIKTAYLIMTFILLVVFTIGWSAVGRLYGGFVSLMKLWMENSPTAIIAAASIFLVFERMPVPKSLQKAVVFIAPSMFGIYLFHEGAGRCIFKPFYTNIENRVSDLFSGGQVVSCFVAAICTFGICLSADILRRISFSIVKHVWGLRKANESASN